jgi:hypothetical protein
MQGFGSPRIEGRFKFSDKLQESNRSNTGDRKRENSMSTNDESD